MKQEAKEAKAKGNRQEAERLQMEASKWEKGGSYRQALSAVTNGIGLALGGAPTEGVIAGTLSPYINTEIKKATEGNDTANILAHGVWGAMEAASQGGSALGGAAAAMTGEVGAKLLAEQLYGQSNPEHLSTEQKQTLSELSQVLAGATAGTISGATGGNSLTAVQAAATGMGVAKSAVENNYLTAPQIKSWLNAYDKSDSEDKKADLILNLDKVDKRQKEQALETKITKEQLEKEETALRALLKDPACSERCQSLAVYSINQLQHLQQNYDELLETKAINTGTGLAIGYATLGAGKVALKLPAVQNYLGSLPYKDKFAGAGLAMGVNAAYQQYKDGEIKASDVLWAGGTAFASSGTSFIKMNAINAGSATTKAYLEDEDPIIAGAASIMSSSAGYGIGKSIELSSSRILNKDYFKDKTKFNYEPVQHSVYPYISTYRKLSPMPSIFGNAGDSVSSEAIGDKSKEWLEQYKNKMDSK
ncbi:VENN motif pre-toxin domain-containing protein [Glaesserella parasuis]|uniref:VENN motif pre-toxin domain-containing protein n=3 Tax=Glaesserella parasuis TaxID=738 RepID=UPI003CEBC3F4